MKRSLDPLEVTALDEIEGGCPVADALAVEAIATQTWESAEGTDAEALAVAGRCTVRQDPLAPIEGVLLLCRLIIVRPRRDARRLALAILHELAHALLERAGIVHSHADVWCLALALAAPASIIEALRKSGDLTARALCAATELPAWAARARLRMGTVTHLVRSTA